ncbi:AAA-domain-containing protein [Tilletiaria anomala UBC 951]|uniref:AAA-domain-containing protein n=1 Tax=Tilletiaria anomala (strain ATCC 24038 / CBS 436.72 / UBC 951) TaxID=1037660 RepID=A0A066VIA0_TILAU|nr:AAA-domain-containing protein [Tilletiaria anomala UBC 951]KDN41226.1 AAA-domain-containing protein [Tilletiaria anomala UBC 951]
MSQPEVGIEPASLTLRPWASTSSRKGAGSSSGPSSSRSCILFSAEYMRARKISTGAPVVIAAPDVAILDKNSRDWCVGAAWPSFSLSGNSAYCVKLACLAVCLHPNLAASSASLSRPDGEVKVKAPPGVKENVLPEASSLRLRISDEQTCVKLTQDDKRLLSIMIKEHLVQKHFVRLMERISLEFNQKLIMFDISGVTLLAPPETEPLCFSLSRSTNVALTKRKGAEKADPQLTNGDSSCLGLSHSTASYSDIGGLDKQIREIRALVELPLLRPHLFDAYRLKPPRGVLLFGPPGTGKTSLARAVAASTHSSVMVINGPELSSAFHGETEAKLRNVFEEAKRKSPCVIIIDEIDALAPRRDAGGGVGAEGAGEGAGEVERRVVATLLTLLDGIDLQTEGSDASETSEGKKPVETPLSKRGPRVVVIAATNRPNAVDPALRRPGRLDREIEIGIPTSAARAAILTVQLKHVPHNLSSTQVEQIAARTHGYVGADLSALVREAGMHAIRRSFEGETDPEDITNHFDKLQLSEAAQAGALGSLSTLQPINVTDILDAMSVVKASAMREIAFETPKVLWTDIASGEGAGASVQQQLRESVEWPLQHPEAFARLGVDAPKGVLLYGPPGCSKTLMARALATESGLNFIAVKGPELFNKFVGESERAVRETFRKARAASPCIVFFDEIDALTTTRGADGEGTGSASDRVIGSLLNEMDGVGTVTSVIVVAATNRPEVIDPALLRPGRFDRLLYVAPPDRGTRLQMLQHRVKRMAIASDVELGAIADMTEGCSGAEVVSICQDAGLLAMSRSLDAQEVAAEDFLQAARSIRRRITRDMIAKYERWQDSVAT